MNFQPGRNNCKGVATQNYLNHAGMGFFGTGYGFHCFNTIEEQRSLLFCCDEGNVGNIPHCADVTGERQKRKSGSKCTADGWNQNGGHQCCSSSNKCGVGEGGCTSHMDCQDGLRCNKGMNNCKAFDPNFPDDANCCVPGNL